LYRILFIIIIVVIVVVVVVDANTPSQMTFFYAMEQNLTKHISVA
jgi:uncharacterized membrane protein YciS (DUF1049 family)